MVYCTKCGSKNSGTARICFQCSATLTSYSTVPQLTNIKLEQVYRFLSIAGLALGLIVALAGIIWLMQQVNLIPSTINVSPFAAIIFGVFLILGAIRGLREHRSS